MSPENDNERNVKKEEIKKVVKKETKESRNPQSAEQQSPWDWGQTDVKLGTKHVIYQKLAKVYVEQI